MQKLPKWLKTYMDESAYEAVLTAVSRAEEKTSGEIVAMIVRRSSTTAHVPLLIVWFLAALGATIAYSVSRAFPDIWHDGYFAVCLIAFSLVGLLISKFPAVQRLVLSKQERANQVDQRAELEFYEAGLEKTEGKTGILLFVSLLERRAVVLADQGIHSKLPPETWENVVSLLVSGIKAKDMAGGFSKAIDACGTILSEHFPIAPDDVNELHDHLIVKD
jgi:putative membrane protein